MGGVTDIRDPAAVQATAPKVAARRRTALLAEVVMLSRPAMWVTTLVPFVFGFVLANKSLLPSNPGEWVDFLVGLVVFGPVSWVSILAVNDANDVDGDIGNPRRSAHPVAAGRMARRVAERISLAAAVVAVALAVTIGWQFVFVTVALLVLGVVYSAPPLRLKTRPGADVALNAVAAGLLAILAGWLTIGSFTGFPWVIAVQGVLVAAAGYIPTTVADYDADLASGYTTFAVRLGRRRAHLAGLACWLAANVGALVLSWHDVVLPRAMLPVLAVACPILVLAYHLAFARAQRYGAIKRAFAVVAALFAIPVGVFLMIYK